MEVEKTEEDIKNLNLNVSPDEEENANTENENTQSQQSEEEVLSESAKQSLKKIKDIEYKILKLDYSLERYANRFKNLWTQVFLYYWRSKAMRKDFLISLKSLVGSFAYETGMIGENATRELCNLDAVDSFGSATVRKTRKTLVHRIDLLIDSANLLHEKGMDMKNYLQTALDTINALYVDKVTKPTNKPFPELQSIFGNGSASIPETPLTADQPEDVFPRKSKKANKKGRSRRIVVTGPKSKEPQQTQSVPVAQTVHDKTPVPAAEPEKDVEMSEQTKPEPAVEPTKDIKMNEPTTEPTKDIKMNEPTTEPTKDIKMSEPTTEPTKDTNMSEPATEPEKDIKMNEPTTEESSKTSVDTPMEEPKEATTLPSNESVDSDSSEMEADSILDEVLSTDADMNQPTKKVETHPQPSTSIPVGQSKRTTKPTTSKRSSPKRADPEDEEYTYLHPHASASPLENEEDSEDEFNYKPKYQWVQKGKKAYLLIEIPNADSDSIRILNKNNDILIKGTRFVYNESNNLYRQFFGGYQSLYEPVEFASKIPIQDDMLLSKPMDASYSDNILTIQFNILDVKKPQVVRPMKKRQAQRAPAASYNRPSPYMNDDGYEDDEDPRSRYSSRRTPTRSPYGYSSRPSRYEEEDEDEDYGRDRYYPSGRYKRPEEEYDYDPYGPSSRRYSNPYSSGRSRQSPYSGRSRQSPYSAGIPFFSGMPFF